MSQCIVLLMNSNDLFTALVRETEGSLGELGMYVDAGAHRLLAYGTWRRCVALVADCLHAASSEAQHDEAMALRAILHQYEAALRLGSAAPAPLVKEVA